MKTVFLFSFADFYESIAYDEAHRDFFDALYNSGAYNWMALLAFFIPMLGLVGFYYFYENPYATNSTLRIWLVILLVITLMILVFLPGIIGGAFLWGIIVKMAVVRLVLFIIGSVFGIGLGKLRSKLHAHLSLIKK